VVRKNPRKIRLKRWNRREIMKKLFIIISTFHTTKSIAIIARRTSQNKPEFFVPIAPTLSIFA
jgi:transposase